MAAKARIDQGQIASARSLRAWNFAFQAITAEICCFSVAVRLLGWTFPGYLYVIAGIYAFGRINELVYAFYRDALDRLEGKAPRIKLEKSERITLLGIGYIETIVQFGLVHLAAQALSLHRAYSHPLRDAFDAIYFSAMTITTTGFGDFYPDSLLPRLVTMYEAVIGIVFLALALGSYLSFTVKPENGDSGKADDDTGGASP
ncbi:potassium channel family protein [Methylobacterium sp. E-065]|uniref:potassium channel family protein n=1 Tax=Methylobacterium sp. E-065 TaxID=2836583 RepID=UPI001FBB9A31|nr:potassium channel family protein [Methylobacterium sp. E-065]MCJ2015891.1 potassium channel family protein [Methylobacterium sp. E-065]